MFSSLLSLRLRNLRRFPFTWWIAVIAIAGIAGFIVTTSVSKASADAAKYNGLSPVYVANRPLIPGTVITSTDISLESRPRAFTPQLARTNSPIGQVVDTPIEKDDVITEGNTGSAGLSPTAALLKSNEQGVAIAINDNTPSFQIGDYVSVIATPQSSGSESTPAFVVVGKARVINVAEHAVTIAVSSDDAPKVAFATAKGVVTLAITTP